MENNVNNTEISYEELNDKNRGSYRLIDLREEQTRSYGMIPGAIAMSEEKLMGDGLADLPEGNEVILYCNRGEKSLQYAGLLQDKGIPALSLKGGYNGWLLGHMMAQEALDSENNGQFARDVEQSIRKKFHKALFSPFAKACKTYELIKPGDKIAVCISGGKDSMLMAKLFQELQRHRQVPFELEFIVMDPGYSQANRQIIEANARKLDIPVTIFESNIFEAVYHIDKSPCYLCARMRRGYLYNHAKMLGCNKIALGHHYDDVIETILMGMMYGSQIQTMMPKLHSSNFEGMELIRPMYLIREDDIKRWRDYHDLRFLQCACRFTDNCSSCNQEGQTSSKRLEIKHLIRDLKTINPNIESNIFRSVENVNLSTIIAYKKNGVKHSFLDTYDEAAPPAKGESPRETDSE